MATSTSLQSICLSAAFCLLGLHVGATPTYTGVGLREARGRAMTMTGWLPRHGGMTAFASSADYLPRRSTYAAEELEGEAGLVPPAEGQWGAEKTPAEIPSLNETPPSRKAPRKPPKGARRDGGHDDDEEEDRRAGPNASASFNAWFPIMLGMFPPSMFGPQPQGQGGKVAAEYGPQGPAGSGPQDLSGKEPAGYGHQNPGYIAAIANSVNNGRHGVASSHAVAYGAPPPSG